MQEPRLGPDDLGDVGQKGDDIVLHLALDGVDAVDVEHRVAALFPDRLGGQLRNDAQFGHLVGGVRLDLSAIAKGFGADRVAEHLREVGIGDALVEVGGELHGVGRKPDGSPWRVLVEAGPEEDDHSLEPCVLDLDGLAVATSGDRWHHYTRRDEHGDERRYTHTIDPRSGAPVEHAAVAVTVVARDAMHADAWATALTVLGEAAGFALAEREGLAVRYLSRDVDGTLRERMTDAFRAHLAQ